MPQCFPTMITCVWSIYDRTIQREVLKTAVKK